MPQIDFYILKNTAPASRLLTACKIVEKAYAREHRIYIHVEDYAQASEIDNLLWTYNDISFIPHGLYKAEDTQFNIQIGYGQTPTSQQDLLINLAIAAPEFFRQFTRVIEIIPALSPGLEQGRARFRYYRDQNLELNTHTI